MFSAEKYSAVLWKNGHFASRFSLAALPCSLRSLLQREGGAQRTFPLDPILASPPLRDPFRFGRFPQQRIMVCWKSLETIKYHLGSFIAALAALGEKRFA